MSRIQNILNKAERDGTVRRVRTNGGDGDPVATAFEPPPLSPVPTLAPMSIVPPPASPIAIEPLSSAGGAATAAALAELPMSRLVTGARLDPSLVTVWSAQSTTAEQYRALRTRVVHANNGGPVSVLLVTSPGRGEGRSVTVANLGLAMAQEAEQRILVVDADLRHPHLGQLFGLPQTPGLTDVLTARIALEDALVTIEEHQITVLPAGSPVARPAELLGTAAMRRTLETLRSRFDRVVIDAPAAAPLADVSILTPYVDSVLLVVRAGLTSKPAIHDAVAAVDPSRLLGVLLNEASA